MKLKTLVKLNEIREHPYQILIRDSYDNKVFYLGVSEYLAYKDKEITDWDFIGDPVNDDDNDCQITVEI